MSWLLTYHLQQLKNPFPHFLSKRRKTDNIHSTVFMFNFNQVKGTFHFPLNPFSSLKWRFYSICNFLFCHCTIIIIIKNVLFDGFWLKAWNMTGLIHQVYCPVLYSIAYTSCLKVGPVTPTPPGQNSSTFSLASMEPNRIRYIDYHKEVTFILIDVHLCGKEI